MHRFLYNIDTCRKYVYKIDLVTGMQRICKVWREASPKSMQNCGDHYLQSLTGNVKFLSIGQKDVRYDMGEVVSNLVGKTACIDINELLNAQKEDKCIEMCTFHWYFYFVIGLRSSCGRRWEDHWWRRMSCLQYAGKMEIIIHLSLCYQLAGCKWRDIQGN